MKFNPNLFPKYNNLTFFEKFMLRTCCYYPPKPRRKREALIINPENYINTLTNAYGEEFWELIKNKKILDFGCGEGGFVVAMATKVNCFAEGIDIQSQFKVAEKCITKHNLKNTKFHLGSSTILKESSFDVLISHDSFEHFENPEAILNEMVSLVKPNGHILIKFGPTWRSPYGRHMSGTFIKSWPWIHLLIPEKNMMRVHSVYHNDIQLYENYSDLIGGLNKMTIAKAKRIIQNQTALQIESMKITPWRGLDLLVKLPVLRELFGSGVYFKCKKND